MDKIYNDYFPVKVNVDSNTVKKIQENIPVSISYDENSYLRLINLINDKIEDIKNFNYNIYNYNIYALKIFIISFIILFFLSDKIEFLSYKDKDVTENNDLKKPDIFKISIISFIIVMIYYLYTGYNFLNELKDMLFQ